MAMTTEYDVICSCGHKGTIVLRENDTPYSANFWQSYKLENLNGRVPNIPEDSSWETIFKLMGVTCPKCGNKLYPNNMVNS